MRSLFRTAVLGAASLAILAISEQAAAQDIPNVGAAEVSEPAPEEIIVTARRRDERLQDVPAAISALSGDLLTATNAITLADVAKLAPSLTFQAYNPRNMNLNIRGLGNNVGIASDGLDPGVGFYVDQVYINRPGASTLDLIDIERVEVLRGPQGTLYGKNTTAGAISVTTARRSFIPSVRAEATVGNLGFLQAKASVNVPISDDLAAFRISGAVTTREGTLRSSAHSTKLNNIDNRLVRAQLLLTPGNDLSIRLIADYSRQTSNCCGQVLADIVSPANGKNFRTIAALFGYTPVIDPFARIADNNERFTIDNRAGGLSAQIDYDFGPATLTSVSAWRKWTYDPTTDVDYTPMSAFVRAQANVSQDQYSQELRLASNGANRIDYVLGAYYFREAIDTRLDFSYGNAATQLLVSQALPAIVLDGVTKLDTDRYRTTSLAAFGQLTFHISDQLSLTGGLRYSHDHKRGSYSAAVSGGVPLVGPLAAFGPIRAAFASPGAFEVDYKKGSVSGTANLAWEVSDDLLLYASFSRGNRSGGLNLNQLPPGISAVVKPETIDAYEAGFKSSFAGGRLTFNLAAFLQYDKDYQATVIDTLRNLPFLSNVPKVRSKGIEFDLQARPARGVTLYSSAAYTDAEYVRFPDGPCPLERSNFASCDYAGLGLPAVPKFALSGGGEVFQESRLFGNATEIYAGADYSHRSSINVSPQLSAATRLPALDLVNARIGVRSADGAIDISLFAKNLFDKQYFEGLAQGAGATGLIHGQLGDPRTYGLTLRFSH